MNSPINILIVGGTGHGKSSLLNFLAGRELAIPSTGKPQTKGIKKHYTTINQQLCVLYDTEGYEATEEGSIEYWNGLIDGELEKHNIKETPSAWFHIIIYCIQATGGRVLEVDFKMIEKLRNESGVLIAITKVDGASDDEIHKLKHVIKKDTGLMESNFFEIATKSRYDPTFNFGKDELSWAICTQWQGIAVKRIPIHIFSEAYSKIDEWRWKEWSWLCSQKMGTWGRNTEDVQKDVNNDFAKFISELNDYITERSRIAFREARDMSDVLQRALPLTHRVNEISSERIALTNSNSEFDWNENGFLNVIGIAVAIPITVIALPFIILGVLFDNGSKDRDKIYDGLSTACRNLKDTLEEREKNLSFELTKRLQ